jgi:OOP family OmpA-OmpF porin
VSKRFATWVMWLAVVGMAASGCSSLSPEQRQGCLIGAGIGALVGGGIGAAGAAGPGHGDSEAYAIGVPVGVVGGAIIGAAMGCFAVRPKPVPPPPPPAPPPPPEQPPAPAPEKIILRGVHFDFNKARIRSADRPVLDEAADTLKANPNLKVYVNGYCDAVGSGKYNLRLSQRRADAVAMYLEDRGIPASQLIPQGFGKTKFVATNSTAEGRAENRRVELVPADQ